MIPRLAARGGNNTPNEIHPQQNQDYKKKPHKGRSLGTSLYIFT